MCTIRDSAHIPFIKDLTNCHVPVYPSILLARSFIINNVNLLEWHIFSNGKRPCVLTFVR